MGIILTVLEVLNKSTEFLEKKGIESPRLNAELLLIEVLKCNRIDLYLRFDKLLKENDIDKYRDWISRRGKFEPLQYITGKVEFYGLPFEVTPDVLIPRPETEIMVEEIIKRCKEKNVKSILDIGTGTGNIPISLIKNTDEVKITSIDISNKALMVAEKNASLNGVESRINFIVSDINDYKTEMKYDLIVSNPPYVGALEYPNLQNEIKNYEPGIAVTDSYDGLYFYRLIAEKSKLLLKNGGDIFLEIGIGQAQEVMEILTNNDFINIRCIKDLQQIDRIVTGELK
jgi:release factor glutamine methyltransferase